MPGRRGERLAPRPGERPSSSSATGPGATAATRCSSPSPTPSPPPVAPPFSTTSPTPRRACAAPTRPPCSKRRPGRSPRLALEATGAERIVHGGRSMGGRIASQVVAAGDRADGLAFLGYPLHPPGQFEKRREAHLPGIGAPMLFVQGTRDAFAREDLLLALMDRLGPRAELHRVDGGRPLVRRPEALGAHARGRARRSRGTPSSPGSTDTDSRSHQGDAMLATLTLAAALAVPSPVGPETRYDPRIPTLKQVVGHDLGEEITSPDQIARLPRRRSPRRRRTGRASSSTRGARRAGRCTCS